MNNCHVTTQVDRGLAEINRKDRIAAAREREIEALIDSYPDPVGVAEVVIDHIEELAALADVDHIAAIDMARRMIERHAYEAAAYVVDGLILRRHIADAMLKAREASNG